MHVSGIVKAWTPLLNLQPNQPTRFVCLHVNSHVCYLMTVLPFPFEMNQIVKAHGRIHRITSKGMNVERYVLLVDRIEKMETIMQIDNESLLYEGVQDCRLVSYCGLVKDCIAIDKYWKLYQVDSVWIISANQLGSKVPLHNLHVLLCNAMNWLGTETKVLFVSCQYNSSPPLEIEAPLRFPLPAFRRFFLQRNIKLAKFVKQVMLNGLDRRSEVFLRKLERAVFGRRVLEGEPIKYTEFFEHQRHCRLASYLESVFKTIPPRFLTITQLKEQGNQLEALQLVEREHNTLSLVYMHHEKAMDDTGSIGVVLLGEASINDQVALITDWALILDNDKLRLIVRQYKTIILTKTSKNKDSFDDYEDTVYKVIWKDEGSAYLFASGNLYELEIGKDAFDQHVLIQGSSIRLRNVIVQGSVIKLTKASNLMVEDVEPFDKYMPQLPRMLIDKVTTASPLGLISFETRQMVRLRLITTCSICEQPLNSSRCPNHGKCESSFVGCLLYSVTFGEQSFLVETGNPQWIKMLLPGMKFLDQDTFVYEHSFLSPLQTSLNPDQEWADNSAEWWTALVSWIADDETHDNSFIKERLLNQKRVRIVYLRKFDPVFDRLE